jgi:hypothetical protein
MPKIIPRRAHSKDSFGLTSKGVGDILHRTNYKEVERVGAQILDLGALVFIQ